jgi:cytochrome c biogenesis protein CcmG/thiol:disulfide interchange protein DsbE
VKRAHKFRAVALAAGFLGLLCIGLIVLLATRSSSQATSFESPLLGRPAPLTAGQSLQGQDIDLAQAKGRVAVINFFASWCPPCQSESAQLSAFAYDQSKRAEGAVMFGVVFNDSNAAARAFVVSHGVDYPVLIDPRGAIANRWGVSSPPTSFLVAADGTVVKAYVGPLSAAQLDRDVAAISRSAKGA